MSKRNYYGSPGGTRNPFGSSGKRRHEKLPPLPTTEQEALFGLINGMSKVSYDYCIEWRKAASHTLDWLKLRLDATIF